MSSTDENAPRTLYAEFTALPGNETEVAALITSHAVSVRAEPGNATFDINRKTDNPAQFFVYEEYADKAAFQAHATADYNAIFNATLLPLIVEDGPVLTWLIKL